MWLAHPTRFERVTFAIGGQRSNRTETTELALAEAKRTPADLDIIELHDAFTAAG
jgi:hypothetical protein